MKFGQRLRLAAILLFRNVELVHCLDGHAAAKDEATLQAIQAPKSALEKLWHTEATMRVHVPHWFEADITAGGLATVRQTMCETVAVLRWNT